MSIRFIDVHRFRNVKESVLQFSDKINLFLGPNGAGKTSILEAISFVIHGKSFRTANSSNLIQIGENTALVRVAARDSRSDREMSVGVELFSNGCRKLKLDGEVATNSVIAYSVPLIIITPNIVNSLMNSPSLRRKFINWGVFQHNFMFQSYWRVFQKILKQRNKALKSFLNKDEIVCWNKEMVIAGEFIASTRESYLKKLFPIILNFIQMLIPEVAEKNIVTLKYKKGWPDGISLNEQLERSLYSDIRYGYTRYGPHICDIEIFFGGANAQNFLSTGQQRAVAYAFYLSQGVLFKEAINVTPMFLLDDISISLDKSKKFKLAEILSDFGGQLFITSASVGNLKDFLEFEDSKIFSVDSGVFS